MDFISEILVKIILVLILFPLFPSLLLLLFKKGSKGRGLVVTFMSLCLLYGFLNINFFCEKIGMQKTLNDHYIRIREKIEFNKKEREERIVLERKEREERLAAERKAESERFAAELEAEQRDKEAKAEKKRKGFHFLSAWNGSHPVFVRMVKKDLLDPKSFKHIETSVTPVSYDILTNGSHNIYMKFRAKNAFGSYVIHTASGFYSHTDLGSVKVLSIE